MVQLISVPLLCVYRIGGKFCQRTLELFPIKMKALPCLDAANICCHLNGSITITGEIWADLIAYACWLSNLQLGDSIMTRVSKTSLEKKNIYFLQTLSKQLPCLYTGRYPTIPCLLSVCFDDAMHGRYAQFYVNKAIRENSFTLDLFVYKTSSISPMHHKSKQRRQKAWDDGVAPIV